MKSILFAGIFLISTHAMASPPPEKGLNTAPIVVCADSWNQIKRVNSDLPYATESLNEKIKNYTANMGYKVSAPTLAVNSEVNLITICVTVTK